MSATLARVLRPRSASLYIVGNVTEAEADFAAKTWWGGWTGWKSAPEGWSPPTTDYAPMPAPVARQVLLFDKAESSQTQVTWRCTLPAGDSTVQMRQRVLADVLSDGAWLALREHTGASYGAGAYVDHTGGLAVLTQEVLVQNDQAAAAVQAFDDLAQQAKAGKLDSRVVAMMKLALAQTYVLGHQSTAQMLDRLMATRGVGPERFDWFDRYAPTLAGVKSSDLPPMLDTCVGHEIVTLVGPKGVVEPLLAKAGVNAEVFDWVAATRDYRARMGLKDEKK